MGENADIAWSAELSTGVPALDDEHRLLIKDFQRLTDPARQADIAYLRATLEEQMAHLCRHFDHEEALMALRGYPDAVAHKQAHTAILDQFNHFQHLLETEPDHRPGVTIVDFVGRWMLEHIAVEDKKLGAFLAGCDAGGFPCGDSAGFGATFMPLGQSHRQNRPPPRRR